MLDLAAWGEAWSAPEPDALLALYAPDAAYVDVGTGASVSGRDGLAGFHRFMLAFAPDSRIVFRDRCVDGSLYSARWTWSGTASGPLRLGSRLYAATGRPFSVDGVAVGSLGGDGLVASHTDVYDMRAALASCGIDEAAAAPRDVALVQRAYEALGTGDAEGLDAVLAEDFVSVLADGMPVGGGRHAGRVAAREDGWWAIGRAFSARAEIVEVLGVEGGRLLARGRYRGRRRSDGAPVDAALTHLWTVADGRLASVEQVTDTARWGVGQE